MSDRETYLIALSERLCPISWDSGLTSLSPAERVFVTIWELEADVNNGGFSQYYFNSAGDNARQAAESLETVGAPSMAEIVRQANALFPAGPPEDRDARAELLESLEAGREDELQSLTDAFCAYPENLSELLYAFVQAQSAVIRGT